MGLCNTLFTPRGAAKSAVAHTMKIRCPRIALEIGGSPRASQSRSNVVVGDK